MKKFMSVLMALVMVFSLVTVSFAGFKDDAQLQFDEDGNFWRVCNYVPSVTYDICEDVNIIRNANIG